jgi:hypothetical protein
MQVILNHPNGKQYRLPATQVVVYNDDGHPVAVTYEHGGLLIHSDASHNDFDRTLFSLKVASIGPMPKAEEASGG